MNREPSIELLGEKRFHAYTLREQGLKLREIASRLGVGVERVRVLYFSAVRKLTRDPNSIESLSSRAFNCLKSVGVFTREQALEAYQSKQIVPLVRPRCYGWKTHEEVAEWLGLPKPAKPEPKVIVKNVCPHCGCRIKSAINSQQHH